MGLKRLALHAGALRIEYQGNALDIHSALPEDLQNIFKNMPWWKEVIAREPRLVQNAKTVD